MAVSINLVSDIIVSSLNINSEVIFNMGWGPPGYPVEPPKLFIPFGRELWGQMVKGDIGDALFIFTVFILPIIVYTLILSLIINFYYPKVLDFLQRKLGR